MKSRFCILLCLFAALCLGGCEFNFDPRNNAAPGVELKLVTNLSRADWSVRYAAPIGGSIGDIPDIVPSRVSLTVNGTAVPADSSTIFHNPMLRSGDKVAIRVDVEGMGTVGGSTTVPEEFKVDTVTFARDEMAGARILTYNVTLDRQPREGEYVGIVLYEQDLYLLEGDWQGGGRSVTARELKHHSPSTATSTDLTVEMAQTFFSGSRMFESNDSTKSRDILTMMPASAFKNRKCTLTVLDFSSLMPARQGVSLPHPPTQKPQILDSLKYHYVEVMGISEELYRYTLSRYKSRSDFLARMGLAPAQFAWSNVEGGFGVCGAWSWPWMFTFEEKFVTLRDDKQNIK